MRESEALVRLQEIDLALIRHRRTLGKMPQTKKIQAVQTARKKLAHEMSKIVGARKDAQMDLDENAQKLRRLHEVVGEVQAKYEGDGVGYRELADLESQLTSLAKRIEKREFNAREYQAKLDKVLATEDKAKAMDKKLVEQGQALLASYREQTADIDRDMAMLKHERESVAESISAETLHRYEEASKRFDGLGVEVLSADKPSVCRVTVPPSAYGDLRRQGDIGECPYCHRILVLK